MFRPPPRPRAAFLIPHTITSHPAATDIKPHMRRRVYDWGGGSPKLRSRTVEALIENALLQRLLLSVLVK